MEEGRIRETVDSAGEPSLPPRTDGKRRLRGGKRTRSASGAQPVWDNRLLALLPAPDIARFRHLFEPVHLERKEILFRAHEPQRHVHFPITAVVSLVSRLESGQMLEVGLVGHDGVAGTVLPGITTMACDGVVQVAGWALRTNADALRRERGNESLVSLLVRYTQLLLVRSMQMSVCNMFHSVEQRCIRWLLTVDDLTAGDHIPLTHELIATMLGVHRPTVTLVLGSLHRAGLLDEKRGRIAIRDRRRLEAVCCDCYGVMCDEQRRLLGY